MFCAINCAYTATSRKVVGKSARDNPERYCGWLWVCCSSKKFERMAWEAMDVCLRVLKESNKRSFDSYSVWNSVLIISHITFQDRRVHIFADNLSRNSCVHGIHVSAHLGYIKSKIPCHSTLNQKLGEVFHPKFFKAHTLVPCSLSKQCTQLHQCMDSESCGSLF